MESTPDKFSQIEKSIVERKLISSGYDEFMLWEKPVSDFHQSNLYYLTLENFHILLNLQSHTDSPQQREMLVFHAVAKRFTSEMRLVSNGQ